MHVDGDCVTYDKYELVQLKLSAWTSSQALLHLLSVMFKPAAISLRAQECAALMLEILEALGVQVHIFTYKYTLLAFFCTHSFPVLFA